MTFEPYQFEHHFSLDPVFDSVAAMYAYARLGNGEPGVMAELSDSVVLLDFEDYAWNRSRAKSAIMRDWWKTLRKFEGGRNLSVTKTCTHCGKSYHPPFGTEKRSKLCSIKCRADANTKRMRGET